MILLEIGNLTTVKGEDHLSPEGYLLNTGAFTLAKTWFECLTAEPKK